MTTAILDHALSYARRGWRVFPLRPNKRSYIRSGRENATTDATEITRWWRSWPRAGIGLVTGPESFFVIDADGEAGAVSLEALALQHGPLPKTLTARTDSGARHLYWRWPTLVDVRNRTDVEPGLHVRGVEGYVVAPPSLCEQAEPYTWEVSPEDGAEVAHAPQWLVDLVTSTATPTPAPVRSPKAFGLSALRAAVQAIGKATAETSGEVLHVQVTGLAEHVRQGYLTRAQVESQTQIAAEQVGVTSLGARALIALALGDAHEPAETTPVEGAIVVRSSDPSALAEAFLDCQRDSAGRPLMRRWRGTWWRYDAGAYCELTDEKAEAPIWRWLARAHVTTPEGPKKVGTSISKVSNVAHALTACPEVHVEETIAPPVWLSGARARDVTVCANGLLDLATGDLSEHTPDLFATWRLDVAWDPAAGRPRRWLAFLEQLLGGDWQAVELIGEWFGYCLTTDTSQQKMLFIVGPKRSGKGTLARVLTALVGRERIAAPTLSGLAGPFGLQPLLSRPVGIIADARLRGRTDEAAVLERLLSITGEDSITVDRKNREAVTARLPTRLMLLSNELPRLSDASAALASRMLVLELQHSFYGREDLDLEGKLLEELPGILAWAVDGWRRLRERGRFAEPESAQDAHEELELLGSPVGRCVRAEFTLDPEEYIEKNTAYARYLLWCKDENIQAVSRATFGRDLRAACPSVREWRPRVDNPDRREFYRGITTRTA